MKNTNSTVLSSRKKLIIILAVITLVLASAAIIMSIVIKPPINEVLKYDSDGDEVYAYISTPDGLNQTVLTQYLKDPADNPFDVTPGTKDVYFTFRAKDAVIKYSPFITPEVPLEKLQSVDISNETGSYSLVSDSNGKFHLKGAPKTRLDTGSVSSLLFQARYMLALEKLDNPSSDLSTYGLSNDDNPTSIVITDTDGNKNTVFLGNPNLSGSGYYMKHADKPHIYIMDTSASTFDLAVTTLISPVLEKPLTENEYNYMESFSINKNGEEFLKSEINSNNTDGSPNLHKITYPANCAPSLLNYYSALMSLANLTGTSVVEYNVSNAENKEELFEKYGLTVPSNEVIYSVADKKCRFITGKVTSAQDGTQSFYAYSEYSDCIVTLPISSVPFLNLEFIELINLNIFQYNIDNVSSIAVKAPGINSNYVLSGSSANLSVNDTKAQRAIDTASFRQMYMSLLQVAVDDYYEPTDTTELPCDLSFTINTKFGKSTTYSFYTLSTLRCLVTVSPGNEYYVVNRAHVDKIIDYNQRLAKGITITPEY